ncbi:MAG TPA: PKD domain-containing protein [Chitinophagaceae bacterium]|nr:PKD domain-containing protein [Chitinophagaceae bacterium]
MKFILLTVSILFGVRSLSQDFSNKGKDFWVGYGSHCQMYSGSAGTDPSTGGSQDMVLYFTSDVAATVTITIPKTGWTRTYTVVPNTVTETQVIPKTGADDVRLRSEGKFSKKSIHITSDKPIVAYAHIYNASVSGATLLFPTNTLGKEYYSLNYKQTSNQAFSYPYCFAIATEDSTILDITPSAATLTHAANVTFRDTLMAGDVLNLLGVITGNTGVDLTGTKIKSIASSTGQCKRIAVFSGSGKLDIICPSGTGGSADNYIQQDFPSTAWGQKYFTVPTKNLPFNYFRVLVKDPTTVVKLNGVVQGGLQNNFFYDLPLTGVPNLIESDKPVVVAQYITTQGACGNGSPGDPEMIYLSPVEQTIDKVTLNSTPHSKIDTNRHFINVVIKTSAAPSFRIDGNTPAVAFNLHPQDPSYSYIQMSVIPGSHTIQADSGFNAIAYGYGSAESYGYNAGTNIRDLTNFITPINPLNISGTNTACAGTPFYFSITYPFEPTSLYWDFHGFPLNNPYPNVTVALPYTIKDSTYLINGKRVYRYKLPTTYTYSPAGNYPVSITAGTSGADDCGNLQTRDDTLFVFNPPVTDIAYTHSGCISDSVFFKDNTNYVPGTSSYKWYWNFGDGTTDSVRNPKHLFTTPGVYNVKFSLISNVGCLSDTSVKQIIIATKPIAKFGISNPSCANKSITFFDSSSAAAPGVLVKWVWDYGDGNIDSFTVSTNPTHTYSTAGAYNVRLTVQSNTGCNSIPYVFPLTVHPNPVVNFNSPPVCLPTGVAQFFDSSSIADNSESGFKYLWNFGDQNSGALNIDSVKNPIHNYSSAGPFSVKLQVTSKDGCTSDTTKILSTVYAQPTSAFSVNAENCFNDTTFFTDQSSGQGNTITSWYWNFGDGQTSASQNPSHLFATANTYTVKLVVKTDKGCLSDTLTKQVIVNPLPTAGFTTSTPICETKAITFTNTSTANAGNIIVWKWNFGDSSVLNLNSGAPFTHTYTNAGTYTVTLSVETDKGCKSAVKTNQITINPQPQPGFILPEVCLRDAFAQFIDTSKIASGSIITWAWNFGDPTSGALNISNAQNPPHKYNAIGNYPVTLTITSNNGCIATLTQTLTVNGDVPVANFNALNPSGLCANDSVAIQDASSVNFGSITKVEIYWDNNGTPVVFDTDDFPLPGETYKHLYPNLQTSKTYTIRYRAYSGISCVAERIKNIIVNAAPKVQFLALRDTCLNINSFQLTQASEIGSVPGTGVYSGPGITNSSGIFDAKIAGVGTHTIRYTFTSSKGCVDYKEQPITILAPPVADLNFSSPDCETKAITFSDISTATAGTITTWTWNFGDGSPVVVKNTSAPFTHVFASANTYNVTLTVTTGNGCNSSATAKSVKVNPLPMVDFSLPKTCLPNANAQFNDMSTITDGTAAQFTYSWNFGDPNSGSANTSTLKNPAHIYSALGPYNVTLQVTSSSGCVKDTVKVYNDIHPQPKANFTFSPASVCLGASINFTDQSNGLDGSIQQYQWNFGDNTTASQQNPSHTFNTAGTYNVRLFIINSQGCNSDTVTKSMIVYPYPVVNAGPDKSVLEGGTVTLEPTVTGNNLQYLWTPSQYLNNTTILNPVVTGVADITYTLTVTANGGCVASDQIVVKVLKFPKIPNTFTPNGDGINETWIIQNLETYPEARVQVFNRYGQLVFESKGYTKPWNGTMNGQSLPFGTYYYIIEPGNGRIPIKGYVTLIK